MVPQQIRAGHGVRIWPGNTCPGCFIDRSMVVRRHSSVTTICPEVSHDGGPRLLLLEGKLEERGSTAMRLAAPSLGRARRGAEMAAERDVMRKIKQPATEAQGMNLSTRFKNKTHGRKTKAPCGGAATGTHTQGHEVQRGSCSGLS